MYGLLPSMCELSTLLCNHSGSQLPYQQRLCWEFVGLFRDIQNDFPKKIVLGWIIEFFN